MAIKTIVKNTSEKKPKPYPKIMIGSLYTILFTTTGTGVVLEVHKGTDKKVGDYQDGCIPMSCYADHNEPVTVQNK